jgi:cysteinyl-tRNA synthetase
MIAGARVEVAPYKKDPRDFVLWKPSKPGEPAWPSPAGIKVPGRPGWHIECSAMSWRYLGEIFDIHGGGIDLVFPHHEDEIAQSRCAFHTPVMANYWMHNGFVELEGAKMSKSEGNFVTIHELLAKWPGSILRFQMLKTHYRQPIDWTLKGTETAMLEVDGFYTFTQHCNKEKGEVPRPVIDALLDDLNTPLAITEIRKLVEQCRTSENPDSQAARDLFASCNFLGVSPVSYGEVYKLQHGSIDETKVKLLIDERAAARTRRDFKESDRIRDELLKMGVEVEDHKNAPSTWKLKKVAS